MGFGDISEVLACKTKYMVVLFIEKGDTGPRKPGF